jgi:predicted RNA-binding Zn-ribbon protein involved in translation (DUF1610 family)
MLKKKTEKEMNEKSEIPSADDGVTLEQKEPTFYRCTCPECGEALEGHFAVVYRSEFLGVTDDGQVGCGDLVLDADHCAVTGCGSCGHTQDKWRLPLEDPQDRVTAHGQAIKRLEFVCPVCGSLCLLRAERASRAVLGVYEIAENSETKGRAEVALSFEHVMEGGKSVRYCCVEGHELAKEDGSPVGTPEELVEWLKALQPSVKK